MKWLTKFKKHIVSRYFKSVEKRNQKALEITQRHILIEEYKLIQQQKSKFSKRQRDHVVLEVKKRVLAGTIKIKELNC